jgi:sugar O-acyltransferase (sialic acid O-acetyltransferase NeuD family)
MPEKLVVVCGGGFGREVMWQIQTADEGKGNYELLGFIDKDPSLAGTHINGFPVLGDDHWLLKYPGALHVVIATGSGRLRKSIYTRLSVNKKIQFPSIILDSTNLPESLSMGKGCIVCQSAVLTTNVTMGDFVVIGIHSLVSHDSVIDKFATLHPFVSVSGHVHIKEYAEIGTGAKIIPGKIIGLRAVIGAGSVVTQDIPDDCTAVGVPARPVRFHE